MRLKCRKVGSASIDSIALNTMALQGDWLLKKIEKNLKKIKT
jgi:hypothetical protein